MPLALAALIDAPALGPRPFLTWYGADGERVEISATVTANWVAKTTNLLVEEFDAGPDTLVRLDLPPHWRTAVWALAAWRAGAGILLDGSAPADVLVTDRPGTSPDGGAGPVAGSPEVVALALPALARRFDGDLPRGAIDAAQAVMTYADVIGYVSPAEPTAPAVVVGAATTAHSDLDSWAADVAPSARLAMTVGSRTPAGVASFCSTVLGALRASTSLVLLGPGHPEPDRILATEHATALP